MINSSNDFSWGDAFKNVDDDKLYDSFLRR